MGRPPAIAYEAEGIERLNGFVELPRGGAEGWALIELGAPDAYEAVVGEWGQARMAGPPATPTRPPV